MDTLTISLERCQRGYGSDLSTWYDRIVVQNLSNGTTLLDTTSYYNAGSIPAGGAAAQFLPVYAA